MSYPPSFVPGEQLAEELILEEAVEDKQRLKEAVAELSDAATLAIGRLEEDHSQRSAEYARRLKDAVQKLKALL